MQHDNLNDILQRDCKLAAQLQLALSAAQLPAAEAVKVERHMGEMQQMAQSIEQKLLSLTTQYMVEEGSAKQQIWERKLLDLSLRNNLLNMKMGKNAISVLGTLASDISQLEDDLDQGREFVLDQKELRGIYRAMRTNLEETGANTLFLTLGTLQWCEREGGKVYAAPILLMPVEMVSLKKGQYAIRKRDDDVMLNITLIEFLRQNFDIQVDGINPLPQDAHGIDVSLVLHQMADSIKEHSGWQIVEDSVLGIFSFTKFVMWNDIHQHAAAMQRSPLVRSLIEGRLLIEDHAGAADARAMDGTSLPDAIALPVDADSSQIEAVVEAQQGRSFVLYGPPGTGKSQTITNLIANALYHRQRVLFVAQKKAALDVVQHRLANIGLSPFCLELHSNKADKRHFLQQLETTINSIASANDDGKSGPAELSNAYRRASAALFEQRSQLLLPIDALHRTNSHGQSLFDCIERYLAITEEIKQMPSSSDERSANILLPDAFCKDNDLAAMEQFSQQIKLLDSANAVIGGMAPSEHPLFGFMPKPQKQESKPAFSSPFLMGDSLEAQLKNLPAVVEAIRQTVERNKTMAFVNKTVRQQVEGDYKFKKLLQLADVDGALLDDADALLTAAKRWAENVHLLPQWQRYAEPLNAFRAAGLQELVDRFMAGSSTELLCKLFQCAYYKQLAQEIISSDSALSQFQGMRFEQAIERYKSLAAKFQLLCRKELVARLSAESPLCSRRPEVSAELTLLRKRIGNKGRGATIRSIIDQMPHLLPSLCPVMLMSPLSVAQYLDVEEQFDLVVFDEASQMPTSEAVGAIARAKAAVVVGDPKQMPPTSFFSVSTTDDEEADIDDMESILDDCISLSMPARYLGWHYRSKHESLIAFSNRNYYDGRLVTFPSSDDMQSHVSLQYVEGYYDYGGTRTNRAEAEAIVAEAMLRMQTSPERSLGIVAFSKPQSDLIEDLLNEQLSEHPELELRNQEATEPLFVKNLENVQGDERDVILFSIGYGPDKNGKVSMNFGPLNKAGGEKRLNVAVSRARYEMKVFATLKPEQIDERRTSAEGVLGLKRFLKFAQSWNVRLEDSEPDATPNASSYSNDNVSVMIRQLADRLRAEGYELRENVGSSVFRINLAVVNPTNPAEYILGIICDDANYYRFKTTRDREIVQPAVLRMLGWNLLHLWTLDWHTNQEFVVKSILDKLRTL